MNARRLSAKILVIAGGIGMAVGAVDALEGSLLILPGSGLLALGTYLGQAERRAVAAKTIAFLLVLLGVGALWGLSVAGGFGGNSGHSNWWGLLLLPYFIGWNIGIWGPGSPRWLLGLGIADGVWYLTLAAIIAKHGGWSAGGLTTVLVVIGLVAVAGCLYRLSAELRARATPAVL